MKSTWMSLTSVVDLQWDILSISLISQLHEDTLFQFGREAHTDVHEICGGQSLVLVKRVLDHVVRLQVHTDLCTRK